MLFRSYMRGLISWLGFRQTGLPYERRPRTSGESKAPFWHLVTFVFSAITSFSLKPLRLFTGFGFLITVASIVAIIVYGLLAIVGYPPAGITTLIMLSWAGIGLNSLGIGILGEYVGRTFNEVKGRPLYIVQETCNIEPLQEEEAYLPHPVADPGASSAARPAQPEATTKHDQ